MKKFNVRVNGKSYKVEVEEVAAGALPGTPAPAVPSRTAPAPAKKPAAVSGGGVTTVTAPMPGTILAIKVKEGETVVQGQVLLILEAMKMENEIPSPVDGKIVSIAVAKRAAVSTGDVLLVME